MKYKDHPLAELFPLMEEKELSELAADIQENGQRAPITLFDGKVIDGRNRLRACDIAGLAPHFRDLPEKTDPLKFVLSANLHRRHLSESQRAMVAAKLAKMSHGGDRKSEASKNQVATLPLDSAAKAVGVSKRTVQTAKTVLEKGTKADVKQVVNGKKTVTEAAREIKQREEKPEEVLDETGYPVPQAAMEFWNRRGEITEMLAHISKARSAIRPVDADKDRMFAETNINAVLSNLNEAYTQLKTAEPYAVCTSCQGQAAKTCTLCRGRGVVSKHRYEMCVPIEHKQLRAKLSKKGASK